MNFKMGPIRVGKAPGKGRGVFATKDIRSGSVVEYSPVLIIPAEDDDALYDSFLGDYVFEYFDVLFSQSAIALGYISLYNHSFDNNADFELMEDGIRIVANRKIDKGEEMCVDYGWDDEMYAKNGIEK